MPAPYCPTTVGRVAESDALSALLRGSGGVVFLVGEPGIGKSRLLQDLARASGARVMHGRAVPHGRASPYRPLAEAVVSACRRDGPPEDPGLVPYRAALGRLLPEWHEPATPAEAGVVLGEGLLRLLGLLGGASGTLLCLEDLHWADPDTVGVLEYLADHAPGRGLYCVATARREPGHGWDLIRGLAARRAATVLELAPLDAGHVADMARGCLAAGALPAGLPELLERADGVPFLVEELLSAASEAGLLRRAGADWVLDPGTEDLLPPTFAEEITARVATLGPRDREVPGAAALLGRQVDVALLASLLERPPDEVLAVLDDCVTAHVLVRELPGYRFRHALVRDAARSTLPPDSLVRLASRARDLVERARPGLPGGWCLLAAGLSRTAGAHADATELGCRAARRAVDAGALTTAARLLDRLDHVAPQVVELRVEVAARAGDVDAAGAAAAPLLVDDADPAGRVRVRLLLAEGAAAAGRWADALEHLDRAGADPVDAGAGALRAHVLLGSARHAEAGDAARAALDAADASGAAEPACQALEVLGRIARERDVGEAARIFGDQHARAEEHGLTLWRLRAEHELGGLDLRCANDTARLQRVAVEAERIGALSMAATALLQIAMTDWISLDHREGVGSARRCQEAARRVGHRQILAEAYMLEASAHGMAGCRAEADRAAAAAVETARDDEAIVAAVDSVYGHSALLVEDRDGALAALDRAVSRARGTPLVYVRPYWHLWALLRTVHDDGGDEARAEVRGLAQSPITIAAAMLRYADAVAAGRRGDPDAASRAFAAARSEVDGPVFAGRRHLAERLVAECALADGWGDPAGWLADAARYFHEAGYGRVALACRRLLREAGLPVPRRDHGHRSVPARLAALGVTDREAEVLELVARGMTNSQVADRLVISVRTVDKHVERLLAKTQRHHHRRHDGSRRLGRGTERPRPGRRGGLLHPRRAVRQRRQRRTLRRTGGDPGRPRIAVRDVVGRRGREGPLPGRRSPVRRRLDDERRAHRGPAGATGHRQAVPDPRGRHRRGPGRAHRPRDRVLEHGRVPDPGRVDARAAGLTRSGSGRARPVARPAAGPALTREPDGAVRGGPAAVRPRRGAREPSEPFAAAPWVSRPWRRSPVGRVPGAASRSLRRRTTRGVAHGQAGAGRAHPRSTVVTSEAVDAGAAAEQVLGLLAKQADAAFAGRMQRYFPTEIRALGVGNASVTAVAADFLRGTGTAISPDTRLAIAEQVLARADHHEDVLLAFALLHKVARTGLADDFLDHCARWLETSVSNWAQCDDLCLKLIDPYLCGHLDRIPATREWVESESGWARRAANVAVVKFVRRKVGRIVYELPPDHVFDNCVALMYDTDEYVQKGSGWLLKVTAQVHPEMVRDFLVEWHREMRRDTFRYALEKMDPDVRTSLMALGRR